MSGFVRTLQKRIMKRRGYLRQTQDIVIEGGRPRVVKLKRGEGPILNVSGDPWNGSREASRHWPRSIPTAEVAV